MNSERTENYYGTSPLGADDPLGPSWAPGRYAVQGKPYITFQAEQRLSPMAMMVSSIASMVP